MVAAGRRLRSEVLKARRGRSSSNDITNLPPPLFSPQTYDISEHTVRKRLKLPSRLIKLLTSEFKPVKKKAKRGIRSSNEVVEKEVSDESESEFKSLEVFYASDSSHTSEEEESLQKKDKKRKRDEKSSKSKGKRRKKDVDEEEDSDVKQGGADDESEQEKGEVSKQEDRVNSDPISY